MSAPSGQQSVLNGNLMMAKEQGENTDGGQSHARDMTLQLLLMFRFKGDATVSSTGHCYNYFLTCVASV